MSSKQARNVDPRIASKEMIVTRTKSAQQKRKLRQKDRSLKSITELLKSPPRVTHRKSTPKKKQPAKILHKVPAKCSDTIEDREFYPDKLKRKLAFKKIVLKPNFPLKVIATTNKRKRRVPRRESKSPVIKCTNQLDSSNNDPYEQITQSPNSELSMSDVVRWSEDTQSLDEEDWMEILTCPSPVWWEDPPDGYCEEAIYCRTSPAKETHEQTDKQTGLVNIDLNKHSRKFVDKRNKLEDLLNNIRNKSSRDTIDVNVDCTDNINPIDKCDSSGKSRLSDSADEDVFSDVSINEEEILNNLENIKIPIETRSEKCEDRKTIVELTNQGVLAKNSAEILSEEAKEECINTDKKPVIKSFISNTDHKDRSRKDCPKDKLKGEDSAENSDMDFMTVYKIIAAPEKVAEDPKMKGIRVKNINQLTYADCNNINVFYKKCKNNRRTVKKLDVQKDINSSSKHHVDKKNTIVVSEKDAMKYCYKCSSLFDTVECSFCKSDSEVKERQLSYDMCKFVSHSRTNIDKHLIGKTQDS